MGKIRANHSQKSKYYLSKHEFYTAYHFALQYTEWKEEHAALTSKGAGSPSLSDEPHGSGVGRPTERDGIRAAELSRKIQRIEDAVAEVVSPAVYEFLLYAVTHEYVSYQKLIARGMPCGKKQYYEARRKFYYIISKGEV